jgi:hypothetical protein
MGELLMLAQFRSLFLSVFLLVVAMWTATTESANAYIDAGTGGLILQFLVAGFFGSLFALKVFWSRITGRLSSFIMKFRGSDPSRH